MSPRKPEPTDSTAELAALAARASNGLLTLGDLKRGPTELVTVAEFDVTPGLHEWIAEEIDKAQAAGAIEARWCAAHRKILAAHSYTERVVSPSYGPHSAGFGCETCHDWDGVPEGRGNCATILALAEGYGLDDEETP